MFLRIIRSAAASTAEPSAAPDHFLSLPSPSSTLLLANYTSLGAAVEENKNHWKRGRLRGCLGKGGGAGGIESERASERGFGFAGEL